MEKLVSILIPAYNRESVIADTIRSALMQSYKNIEIVVVDNASTDGTWSVIQSMAGSDDRVRAFRNESNLGPVRNWQRCVDEATGFYGKILWSDDLIAPDFIEKTLSIFDDDMAFVYSGVRVFTDTVEGGDDYYFIGNTGARPSDEYIDRVLLDSNVPVSPGCAIFRLSDLKKNLLVNIENKVNSDFSMHAIGNDLMLFLLVAKDYKTFGFVSERLSYFRAHEDSISVGSSGVKLRVHYLLVKTLFCEKYYRRLYDELYFEALWLVLMYPECRQYGFVSVSDFFNGSCRPRRARVFLFFVLRFYNVLKIRGRRLLFRRAGR